MTTRLITQKGIGALLAGLFFISASVGTKPRITAIDYPRSHFFSAPRLSSFELLIDGKPRHREDSVTGSGGKALQVTLGTPLFTGMADTMRRPLIQTGWVEFRVPMTFEADGIKVGESTMLAPVRNDSVTVRLEMTRFGWFPRNPARESIEHLLISAVAQALRKRVDEGNAQSKLKPHHGGA